ncbi:MAG: hypothetical protein KatS3mg111_4070 [Pirellulaceae bacterium]|nr:MAG: hypothetical protein KatS3mg111_4070 [Pirellulaceae bacterium]
MTQLLRRPIAVVPVLWMAGAVLVGSPRHTYGEEQSREQQQWQQMVDRAIEYLRVRGQRADGSFSPQTGIGPTGLGSGGAASGRCAARGSHGEEGVGTT